MEATVTELQR